MVPLNAISSKECSNIDDAKTERDNKVAEIFANNVDAILCKTYPYKNRERISDIPENFERK